MIDFIHLEINNGKTDDWKESIHVFGLKAPDTYSLTVCYENSAEGKSWHEEGPAEGNALDNGEFWHDLVEGAIYGMAENWTRCAPNLSPDDFLADPNNAWMNGFTADDFAPANWDDATKL